MPRKPPVTTATRLSNWNMIPSSFLSGLEARDRAPFGHRFGLVRYQRTIALPHAKPPPSAQNSTF